MKLRVSTGDVEINSEITVITFIYTLGKLERALPCIKGAAATDTDYVLFFTIILQINTLKKL